MFRMLSRETVPDYLYGRSLGEGGRQVRKRKRGCDAGSRERERSVNALVFLLALKTGGGWGAQPRAQVVPLGAREGQEEGTSSANTLIVAQ